MGVWYNTLGVPKFTTLRFRNKRFTIFWEGKVSRSLAVKLQSSKHEILRLPKFSRSRYMLPRYST